METNEVAIPRPSRAITHACLQCRRVKMKCHKAAKDAKCARCLRKSLQCDFLEHRRGRKQGFKLHKAVSRAGQVAVTASETGDLTTQTIGAPGMAPYHLSLTASTFIDGNGSAHQHDTRQRVIPPSPSSSRIGGTERLQEDFWTQSSGFQPADVLSRQATRGMFSLQNVLSTRHGTTSNQTSQSISNSDPIVKGLVNLHVSTSLFEGFMKHLNPFVSQFDPCFHTFNHTRGSSSFLFTAILAAAAKLLHASLSSALSTHAEELLIESFRRGSKSVEVIQAILILTYWKRSDDSRAWLSVGYAIRMAIELGWHQIGSDEMRPPKNASEFAARRFRDIERTWLVLFVYDRSISFQTGKPWMIERSAYIESANNWFQHPLAITNDRLLSAFVSLRLITSTHSETMTFRGIQEQRQQTLQFRSLLRLLDRQIEDWQRNWLEAIASDGEACHAFLIPFYGSYARLLLFTSPLRSSLRLKDITTSVDTEAIWNSCASALDMLRLVSEASTSQLLYFAQDSVQVMIAYATVFLIKLLVSAPTYIRSEMERPTIGAIRDAAKTLTEQAAPRNTGCALQAKFLHNVLLEYEAINERQHCARNNRDNHEHLSPRTTTANLGGTNLSQNPAHQNSYLESSVAPTHDVQGHEAPTAYDDQDVQTAASQDASESLDFANDELWTVIFANAGFNIDEGTFTHLV